MSTHNITGLWILIRIDLASIHNLCFSWRTEDNCPKIIINYPPYLFLIMLISTRTDKEGI